MKANTDRQLLIKKLLNTFHLNNIDRQVFKEHPISLKEIRHIVHSELQVGNIFPSIAGNSESVFEGHFIEKINPNEFVLIWQRHHPVNPFQLAERFEYKYSDFEKIIHDYIEKEHNFNIDGLTIIN